MGLDGPLGFISNTAPSSESGEHWIAYFRDGPPGYPLECFDSFGRGPQMYNYDYDTSSCAFLSTSVNSHQFQSTTSKVCGYYALFYVLSRSHNYSYQNIMKSLLHYFPNSSLCDKSVVKYVNETYPIPKSRNSHCSKCCNQCSKSLSQINFTKTKNPTYPFILV